MTLSPREREVLTLVGRDGVSYGEIAETLGISVSTIKSYVSRILARYPSQKLPREALAELYWRAMPADDVPVTVAPKADCRYLTGHPIFRVCQTNSKPRLRL